MKLRRSFAPAAFALLAACASGGRGTAATDAELVVEVYSGFASGAPALAPAPAHVVVDVSSMLAAGAPSVPDDEQRRLAQNLIVPYLTQHPGIGLESAAVHVFRRGDPAPGESCSDPASGASLAAGRALERLAEELAQSDAGGHARVVLFSRFEGECMPRLCEAAARVVERGAWLDLAAIQSDAGVPACLASLRPKAAARIPWLAGFHPATPAAFSVEAVNPAGREGPAVAQGSAGTPIRAEAGLLRIRIALDPPEVVGPIQVRPGQRLRIRVMDFPLSAPGERSWQVEAADAKR